MFRQVRTALRAPLVRSGNSRDRLRAHSRDFDDLGFVE
jgi:hypothetical protein